MKKAKCTYCGGTNHYAINCYLKRSDEYKAKKLKRIKPESRDTHKKRVAISREFFIENPPDESGGYICYLQISKDCPIWVNKNEVSLEHVLPKVKFPELRFNVFNLKAACAHCNKLKSSNTPYQLAVFYPQVYAMLKSIEWKKWEINIEPFIHRPLPKIPV